MYICQTEEQHCYTNHNFAVLCCGQAKNQPSFYEICVLYVMSKCHEFYCVRSVCVNRHCTVILVPHFYMSSVENIYTNDKNIYQLHIMSFICSQSHSNHSHRRQSQHINVQTDKSTKYICVTWAFCFLFFGFLVTHFSNSSA